MPNSDHHPHPARATHPGRTAALVFVVLWFALGGVAHFVFTEVEMRTVPSWIPWPREAVLWSGVAELAGAAGLLWGRTRRAAGGGLLLLTLLVTPANVYMVQHAEEFAGVPVWALMARLPLQGVLLVLIAFAARIWPVGRGGSHALENR